MDINAYLINAPGTDWGVVLSDWAELLPPSLSVWFVNRFGDLFAVLEDGSDS